MDSGKSTGTENPEVTSLGEIFQETVDKLKKSRKRQIKGLDRLFDLFQKNQYPNAAIAATLRRELEVRLDEDVALLRAMTVLAQAIDRLEGHFEPTAELTLRHEKTYQELQKLLNRMAESASKELVYVA